MRYGVVIEHKEVHVMITKGMSAEERLAYCQSVIQEQKDSGLSVTKWCQQKGVSKPRYYRYLRVCQEAAEGKEEGGVYQLPQLAAVPEENEVITLEAGGVKVQIGRDVDWEKACAVLRALK